MLAESPVFYRIIHECGKKFCENVFRSSTNFCVCESFRLLQNRVQATHIFLKDYDLEWAWEWGAPCLGDDLGWGGEATRDAQGCGGGPPPLGLLERDIILSFND